MVKYSSDINIKLKEELYELDKDLKLQDEFEYVQFLYNEIAQEYLLLYKIGRMYPVFKRVIDFNDIEQSKINVNSVYDKLVRERIDMVNIITNNINIILKALDYNMYIYYVNKVIDTNNTLIKKLSQDFMENSSIKMSVYRKHINKYIHIKLIGVNTEIVFTPTFPCVNNIYVIRRDGRLYPIEYDELADYIISIIDTPKIKIYLYVGG